MTRFHLDTLVLSKRGKRYPDQRTADWMQALGTDALCTSALRWGDLSIALKRRDLDLFIAATALEHDPTVVTRNVRHFKTTGVKLLNPYEA